MVVLVKALPECMCLEQWEIACSFRPVITNMTEEIARPERFVKSTYNFPHNNYVAVNLIWRMEDWTEPLLTFPHCNDRNLPIAMLLGLAVVIVLHVLGNLTYFVVLSIEELHTTSAVAVVSINKYY